MLQHNITQLEYAIIGIVGILLHNIGVSIIGYILVSTLQNLQLGTYVTTQLSKTFTCYWAIYYTSRNCVYQTLCLHVLKQLDYRVSMPKFAQSNNSKKSKKKFF